MNDFFLYFSLGLQHIMDWQGYDHILFIFALIAVYEWQAYRQVFVLITAFTLGHSLSLALSVLDFVTVSPLLVEFLIPLTIVFTAISNLFSKLETIRLKRLKYGLALVFGCIHGLGFSNYLKSLLAHDEQVFKPLLAFNLGLELGQLLIIIAIFCLLFLLNRMFLVPTREKVVFISGATFGIAFIMMVERLYIWLNGL